MGIISCGTPAHVESRRPASGAEDTVIALGERLPPVGALRDDFDVRRVLETDLEPAARELLVVDDDGAYAHGSIISGPPFHMAA
jgi:hypothetical protein